MKGADLIKLSTRMFIARKGRTALTILGMGIGFGAILFLVSLGYGLQNALLSTITSSGALTTLDVSPDEEGGNLLTQAAAEEIGKIDGVAKVETGYDFSARIKLEDNTTDARAVVGTHGFIELEGIKVVAGKMADQKNEKEILISSAFGKILGKSPEELVGAKNSFVLLPNQTSGEAVTNQNIEAQDFVVVGVVESEETVFYAKAGGLKIPPNILFSKIKAQCNSSDLMSAVKDAISQKGFSVSSISETITEVNKLFRVVNIVLGLFGIVTLVVSAIGMFNTMTVALLERTREIGIMRSIGASRIDIWSIFVIESTLMGFFGGVVGVVLGFASGQIVNLIVNVAAKYMGGKSLNLFSYPLWFLGFILLFSIFIGFATGVAPAKRASSLDPLEALRSR